MDQLASFAVYVGSFIVLITVLVFVHELGHYLVARWNGVRVEVFSIGFGPELFGWTDSRDTRWKVAAIPMGGFVKFFGDAGPASQADNEAQKEMSAAEQAVSFHHKRLGQRAAIVAAGPVANFIYAIVVLSLMFMVVGQRVTPPEIGRVLPGSAGEAAGLQPGDIVLEVDGQSVRRFEELDQAIFLNPGRPLELVVRRDGEALQVVATPAPVEGDTRDGMARLYGDLGLRPSNPAVVGGVAPGSAAAEAGFETGDRIVELDGKAVDSFEELQDIVAVSEGRRMDVVVERDGRDVRMSVAARETVHKATDGTERKRWLIGILGSRRDPVQLGPVEAVSEASWTSYDMIVKTIEYVGQMITGGRGTEDLGGPLRIAQASGQAAQVGLEQFIFLSVLLSLNLGLINLFPVPILDGGHLLMYGIEAVRGRPLTERMQEYAFRLGLAFVLTLMVFATWNDLVNVGIVDFLSGLFS